MATRATRSAGGRSDDASHCLLLALSHDELGVIVDGLADPLQPVVAVALSSTCKGLRTPLLAVLEVLKGRHTQAVALCRKVGMSFAQLRDAEKLYWSSRGLTADDMATLGIILRTNGLLWLKQLFLFNNGFGNASVQALCEGMSHGAPLLRVLSLGNNEFGPAGAEALAAALRRGALPNLELLSLSSTPIGNQGVAALAAPLRKMPALNQLFLARCEIGDKGVASLVSNLGKDDFKQLETFHLTYNKITDAGMVKIVAAIDAGGLPKMRFLSSDAAGTAVSDALAKRSQ